jgi:hypothetical protein
MVTIAHNLIENHPAYVKHFMLTLKIISNTKLLNKTDASDKLKERYKNIPNSLRIAKLRKT